MGKKHSKLYNWLLYITNNHEISKDEEKWDIGGFILATVVLFAGIIVIILVKEYVWAAFLIIEYLWYIDNMRHNRL
jgi:hypothetical protein